MRERPALRLLVDEKHNKAWLQCDEDTLHPIPGVMNVYVGDGKATLTKYRRAAIVLDISIDHYQKVSCFEIESKIGCKDEE